jgi:hypothetical protein
MAKKIDPQMQERQMSNQVFRRILNSLEQVVGADNMKKILTSANLAQYIGNYPPRNNTFGGHKATYNGAMHKAVYEMYGERGANSILDVAGRAQAQDGIQQNATLVNLMRIPFSVLPMRTRIHTILDNIARVSNQEAGTAIQLTEEKGKYDWNDPMCSQCLEISSQLPVCATTKGWIIGAVTAVVPSASIQIEEIECKAKGDPSCRFRITLPNENKPDIPDPI